MIGTRLRKWLLWGALAATLGSALLAPSEESPRQDARRGARGPAAGGVPAVGAAPAAATARAAVPNAADSALLVRPARESDEGMVINLFEARLPPAPSPEAPAKPTAPPLPFVYMGSIEDNGTVKVFLVQGQNVLEATPGSAFAGNYRLDAIGVAGLTITYLPLNMQQTLPTGGAK